MRRDLLLASLGFCFLVVLAIGCASSPTPTPTVTAVQPTATAAIAITTALSTAPTTTNVITMTPFVLHLPTVAPVFYPTEDEWGNRIGALQQEQPQLAAYLKSLADLSTDEEQVAFAQLSAGDQELTLIAAVAPSAGLTLQTYLAAAQAELAQSRFALGSGVVVEKATIRYDLHEEQIPLAVIQYTLPTNGRDAAAALAGYQAAMLDQTGADMLLLTFVSQSGQPTTQDLIETILARLQATTIDQ